MFINIANVYKNYKKTNFFTLFSPFITTFFYLYTVEKIYFIAGRNYRNFATM